METSANTILEVSMMYVVPRCLHVVAEMGIADMIADDGRTAEEMAGRAEANADAVGRCLALLSAYGLFKPVQDDGGHIRFIHTPASLLLRTDHPHSMRSFVRTMGNTLSWKSAEMLLHTLRTGEPSVELISPGGQWPYFATHPEERRIFDDAMKGKAHAQLVGILAKYDFSPFRTIADIGGGHGHLLQAVLAANPDATGVLFEQPHVIENVAGIASDRLTLQGGDFFKDTLPVCDAYLILQVIHDWDDDRSVQILRSIRRSAPAHAKLLVIEGILPDDSNPSWIKMLDILMLTLLGGRERTRSQFDNLLAASGFQLNSVIDAGLGTSILEATPVQDGLLPVDFVSSF